MHMADALLSPAVGTTFWAAGAGAIAYSAKKLGSGGLEEKSVPLMGVLGAFVFTAQMINFTIPGTGSSGHIGGGILLAALLGPYPAFLTLSAVLIIQALFFADGGLLALGANIFNIAWIPCLLTYPMLFRPLFKNNPTARTLSVATILSVVLGLLAGAFMVVLQTTASGVTALPFGTFAALMLPIHLAIGLVEGLATAAVLLFVFQTRPDLLGGTAQVKSGKMSLSRKNVLVIFVVAALLLGGLVALFASANPDGLEWSIERAAGVAELEAGAGLHEAGAALQEKTALLPDYQLPQSDNESLGTSVSGLLGGTMTFAAALAVGWLLKRFKKRAALKPNA